MRLRLTHVLKFPKRFEGKFLAFATFSLILCPNALFYTVSGAASELLYELGRMVGAMDSWLSLALKASD